MVPYGWKDVDVGIDALATLTLPNGTTIQRGRHFDFEDSSTKFNALIGWHDGNWHWNVGALLNVPIGPWHTESISNIAFLDAEGTSEINVSLQSSRDGTGRYWRSGQLS